MIAKEEENKGKKLIWIVLIIIIIALMFFGKLLNGDIQDLFKQTEKSLELVQTINIPWDKDSIIKNYGGVIINSDNNIITSYNLSGDKLWSKSVDFEVPFTHLGENAIYTGDKIKGQIVAFSIEGEKKWTYEARQSIDKFVEKNGLLIIYTKAGEQIDQINILDEKGSLLANTIIDEGRLLSSNISPDQKKFILVTIDFSGNILQSSLLLYTIEGQLLWKKDYTDLIILDADFIDNDTMLAISDSKIISLNAENELLWSKDIKGRLKDAKLDNKQKEIYLLYEEDKGYIEVLEPNGKTKNKLALDNYYNSIYTNKRNVFLVGEDRLIGIHEGEAFLNYTCEAEIESLIFDKDNILVLTKENLIIGKLSSKKEQGNN
ncbi:DUF5711 family protein [Proteiniborus sp. MB09-C3]|uniref:DUF5711 family protein n=1 Tax=Proteiniborus sp. MB09-C3 TaxID=3050072 RepID=UPI002554126B|nr:DUF5711 family protein [Proteiniborus sp. MB09-C3]WIV12538.1 DUF5711 family protein [Proteiniborus sp. MB09-C3]